MIWLWFIAISFAWGIGFIVGGHIGIRRGREQTMREIEEHWYDQHNHRL